jgi:pimeloyl-ACP methyl ester carboxylesterase
MEGASSRAAIETIPVSENLALHTVTSGSGPPLALIHGVAGSSMVWDRIVPLLEPYFTVVRFDLLGYGHSPKPRITYSPLRHVTAIRRTLAQLGIAAPSAFVGLSMGSNLMLEYARSWPDEVLDMVAIGFPFYPSEAAARVGLRHNPWTRMALQHPILARVVVPSAWFVGRRTVGFFSLQIHHLYRRNGQGCAPRSVSCLPVEFARMHGQLPIG